MFTWLQLALALLKLVNGIVGWYKQEQLIEAGVDKEIARTSASIFTKTATAKQIMEEVSGLSEDEVDVALRRLERDGV